MSKGKIADTCRLLKRRQIKHSRACAIATAYLLRSVVSSFRAQDVTKLLERVRSVGRRLCTAQPREMVVGNIVRRILGLIREEAEDEREGESSMYSDTGSDSRPHTPYSGDQSSPHRSPHRPQIPSSSISTFSPLRHGVPFDVDTAVMQPGTDAEHASQGAESGLNRPPLLTSHTSYAVNTSAAPVTSMFNLLSHPDSRASPTASGTQTPNKSPLTAQDVAGLGAVRDLRAEVIDGIGEIIDELGQVDDQIAGYALDHIHSNEIILTYTSSSTVQKFLLKAATKRKFTVIHAEAYPNNHEVTHKTVTGNVDENNADSLALDSFQKPLTAAGITVILVPDSAVFALMSRVNKVILGTHAVLANGGLVAAAGAKSIATAARVHRIPVVVVSGVYKLSPVYPFDFESLIEYGDASKILGYDEGDMVDKVDVENPIYDYVPAELVDLYITNL